MKTYTEKQHNIVKEEFAHSIDLASIIVNESREEDFLPALKGQALVDRCIDYIKNVHPYTYNIAEKFDVVEIFTKDGANILRNRQLNYESILSNNPETYY